MPEAVLDPRFLTVPIAHRALHDRSLGHVENAPQSVREAISAGYGIEIDLQPSRDGLPMVFHDYELDRLTPETGLVRDRDQTELSQIGLTDSTDTIPTLADVLEMVGGRVPLLVEVKDQDGKLGPSDTGFEEKIAAALAGYAGPVAIMSFNPHVVGRFSELLPHVPRGLVTDDFSSPYWAHVPADDVMRLHRQADLSATGATFISHNSKHLDMDVVGKAKASGLSILTWTIRSEKDETVARGIADNVTFEGYRPAIG